MIAAVALTLRLSATPSIGIRTAVTPAPRHVSSSPRASLPRTIAMDPRRSASVYSTGASTTVATGRIARSASHRWAVDASVIASGTENTVPRLARIAFGFHGSVVGSATMTASTPAPSAERMTAPRLPGFSNASSTATSGSGGSRDPTASNDVSGVLATASSPSLRSPNPIRPMSSAVTSTTAAPVAVAPANASRASVPADSTPSCATNSSVIWTPAATARAIFRAPSMSI